MGKKKTHTFSIELTSINFNLLLRLLSRIKYITANIF